MVDGTPPPPLAAHSCAVVERRVYLFGGLTIGGASDALYCLDTGEKLMLISRLWGGWLMNALFCCSWLFLMLIQRSLLIILKVCWVASPLIKLVCFLLVSIAQLPDTTIWTLWSFDYIRRCQECSQIGLLEEETDWTKKEAFNQLKTASFYIRLAVVSAGM